MKQCFYVIFTLFILLTAAQLACLEARTQPSDPASRTTETQAQKADINIPFPAHGDIIYVTISDLAQSFALPGKITAITPAETFTAHYWETLADGQNTFRAKRPGYYNIKIKDRNKNFTVNLFVSPLPSVHVEREDINWYHTQFRSSTTSNCGPTVVSMGIGWATGRNVPVRAIREFLGWQGSGAVSFYDMRQSLAHYGVASLINEISCPQEIFDIIDRKHVAGILYNMSGLTYEPAPQSRLFNQYYIDKGGHYLMVKGYSLDKRYLIIHDPIPSDWKENRLRYTDGTSMIGRNRYYLVSELFRALISKQVLEIIR